MAGWAASESPARDPHGSPNWCLLFIMLSLSGAKSNAIAGACGLFSAPQARLTAPLRIGAASQIHSSLRNLWFLSLLVPGNPLRCLPG